ncbi:MAG: hypothetical protein LBG48_00095 [Rickettsiales bacterium]|nr:hypothetical protein [Rickettsiales bacterium]
MKQKKKLEGKQHPDRNEQFNHINKEVKKALKSGNPVVLSGFKERKRFRLFLQKRSNMVSNRLPYRG